MRARTSLNTPNFTPKNSSGRNVNVSTQEFQFRNSRLMSSPIQSSPQKENSLSPDTQYQSIYYQEKKKKQDKAFILQRLRQSFEQKHIKDQLNLRGQKTSVIKSVNSSPINRQNMKGNPGFAHSQMQMPRIGDPVKNQYVYNRQSINAFHPRKSEFHSSFQFMYQDNSLQSGERQMYLLEKLSKQKQDKLNQYQLMRQSIENQHRLMELQKMEKIFEKQRQIEKKLNNAASQIQRAYRSWRMRKFKDVVMKYVQRDRIEIEEGKEVLSKVLAEMKHETNLYLEKYKDKYSNLNPNQSEDSELSSFVS
ncbi:UNKNOWN [Stylonychia lemnae]|uniref:Uncharacterized protein n=1 Tax=Stylonychia lemnae TaxID=5949 RepID=A0A078A362_STYLE|nr:UNKNOWN [Stylonychia lemnae]|eukprot:CDW75204.1 UNKNOWN [Stylonychia lemnae]